MTHFEDRAMSYSPGFDNTTFNTTRPNLDMSAVNGQNNTPVFGTNSPVPIGGGFGHQDQPRIMPLHKNRSGVESRLSGYSSENGSPFLQHAQAVPTQVPEPTYQNGVPSTHEHIGSHVQALPQQQSPYPIQPASPWGVPQASRSNPFEPDYPTARNTSVVPGALVTGRQTIGAQPSPIHVPQSPWAPVPHPGTYEPWTTDANRAPAADIEPVSQVEQVQSVAPTTSVQPSPAIPEAVPTLVQEAEQSAAEVAALSPAPEPTTTRSKKQRKEHSPPKAVSPTPAPVAVPVKTPSPAPSPADVKPAWAVDEEKPSTVTSLREIQELEAKQAEARKAAERAARAAAAAVPSPPTEELQSFTASWGLPISQAGASRSNPLLKEVAASSPIPTSPSAPAVWTNAIKTTVAKKTMKEIQEEEEKRKKQAVKEKETVAATARRAYAETTTKVRCLFIPCRMLVR